MQTRKTELGRGDGQKSHGWCADEVRYRSSNSPLLTNHQSINRTVLFSYLNRAAHDWQLSSRRIARLRR